MKKQLLLLYMIELSFGCSVARNWRPGSIQESIERSGAVLIGQVENPKPHHLQRHVFLKNVQYYKGCGPSRVRVNNYSSSTQCGVSAPKDGKTVIVFACKKTTEEEDKAKGIVQWNLNRYTNYAGQTIFSEKNFKIISDLLGDQKVCINETVKFTECVPRKKEEQVLKDVASNIRKPFFSPQLMLDPKVELLKPKAEDNESGKVQTTEGGKGDKKQEDKQTVSTTTSHSRPSSMSFDQILSITALISFIFFK